MAKLVWDATGNHLYETGIDHVVLYKAADTATGGERNTGYLAGVAWNGCTGITETPSGGEETKLWADNIKYLSLRSAEDYGATITAYTYPVEWEECDGSATYDIPAAGTGTVAVPGIMSISQQPRKGFCLAFRTLVGNDQKGSDFGYKIHILYGCSTSPSEKANKTVNESPEANEFSWTISTQPIEPNLTIGGKVIKPTARIVLDVSQLTRLDQTSSTYSTNMPKIKTIEDYLFGRNADATANPAVEALNPSILYPSEIYSILTTGSLPVSG